MPDELHTRLKAVAKEKGTNVTALINTIIGDYVGEEGNQDWINTVENRLEALEKEVFRK